MSTATIEQPTTTTTTTTETPCVRFKKRQATGDWRLFGPETLVIEGPVTVTKKNGKISIENVLSVGASFDVAGVLHRYGYLKPKAEGTAPNPAAFAPTMADANFVPDDFEPSADVDFMPADDDQDTADWDF